MIEFAMIFALGVLSAALVALMLLPALSRRADRLAQRRVQDAFPVSIAEISAERDRMRAEMAVEVRKAEARSEELSKARAEDMAELGRRAVALHALEESLTARDGNVRRLEGELANAVGALAATRSELAEASNRAGDLTRRIGDVEAIRDALERVQAATNQELATARAEIAASQARVAELRDALAIRDETFEKLADDHQRVSALAAERQVEIANMVGTVESANRLRAEVERKIAVSVDIIAERGHTISELTHKLSERDARLALGQRKLADAEANLAQANERIASLTRDKTGLVEEIVTMGRDMKDALSVSSRSTTIEKRLRERIATLEDEIRSAREEVGLTTKDLSLKVETLTAERGALQSALDQARNDRTKLQRELTALRRELREGPQRIEKENADLRLRLSELADVIMAAGEIKAEPKAPGKPKRDRSRRRKAQAAAAARDVELAGAGNGAVRDR